MTRVAIVEDTHEIRNGLRTILESTEGFVFDSEYSNAEEALDGLPLTRPDVVIMDIGLPGQSGIECVKQLKVKLPATLVMIFTVFEDDQKIFDALKAGANSYLLKNTPTPKILEAITELMEGGSPMSISIARKVVSFFQAQGPKPEAHELTAREKEILQLLSNGLLYKEIAAELNIATGTVKRHIHQVYQKLHVENRTEALNKVFPKRTGFLSFLFA